jgi:hypothetical protein
MATIVLFARGGELTARAATSRPGITDAQYYAASNDNSYAELRGTLFRILEAGEEERMWREALVTVIRGFRAP